MPLQRSPAARVTAPSPRLSRGPAPSVHSAVADTDDAQLVGRLKRGDGAAFDEAYARHNAALYAFLARLLGRRDLAEDLLQETWLRLATRAADLRDDTRLRAWLFTVARNLSLSFLRWRLLDGERLGTLRVSWFRDGGQPSPFDLTAASELEARLERALAALPVRYREVLLLCGVHGLAPQDAAAVLRLQPEALRQRLARARAMIEDQLDDGVAAVPREAE
jgi:RNA polymerase sigma-70 factor (ECF subfamily)